VAASIAQMGADQAISIELLDSPGPAGLRRRQPRPKAYLIEQPASAPAAAPTWMLALPTPSAPAIAPRRLQLPSAIESVVLSSADNQPGAPVQLTVSRKVPMTGWFVLGGALFTAYSSAAASGLSRAALPSVGRSAFLRLAWRGMGSSLAAGAFACAYPTSRHDLATALRMELPRDVTRKLLCAGIALSVDYGAFNLALGSTSISHASLFESCSSIHIVLAQLGMHAIGRGRAVPRWHILGVVLGGVGAYLATQDAASGDSGSAATPPGLSGDLAALVAGVGAATYLSVAESLRLDIDVLAFYCLVMAQMAVFGLCAASILDSEPPSLHRPLDRQHGVFGWLVPIPARLLTQVWLALVVDVGGNFGFIASMQYVPALVVAAVMLLGPLTSCLEGIAVGVDVLPGPWTLSGAALITFGSGLIAFTSRETSATVEISRG